MAQMTVKPQDIEAKSFEIITSELGEKNLNPQYEHIIKRCIHTSADFDYANSLYFSENVGDIIEAALKEGCDIVTDTQMARSGINKAALQQLGIEVHCFIGDDDVALAAKANGTTRAAAAVEKAVKMGKPFIFAVGNAPTALLKLRELIDSGDYTPRAIIGVPVGFVNVVESKELIIDTVVPCIVARGRKGGSNIAAAICNAVLYRVTERNS